MKLQVVVLLLTFYSVNIFATNLHLIDKDNSTGFAIYRTSKPKKIRDMKELCRLGVEEIAVLSGNADDYEEMNREGCPNLKVVYNEKQSAKIAISKSFLDWFDSWVEEARRTGKKIAFRCNCGCHRTGRLAAYYQMKYQGLTSTDAKILMKKHGKWMFLHKGLWPQVTAMEDYIEGRKCTTRQKFCVNLNE